MSIVVGVLFNDPRVKCNFCQKNADLKCLELEGIDNTGVGFRVIMCKACIHEVFTVLAMNEGVR